MPVPKGCVLLLTVEEYAKGLARGKAYRRIEALRVRLAQTEQRGTLCA